MRPLLRLLLALRAVATCPRAALAGLALLLAACAPLAPVRLPVVPRLASPPPFPEFAPHPAAFPVIPSGRAGLPIMVFDPAIYVDAEGYHLFYTTPFCRGRNGYRYSWDPSSRHDCNIMHTVGSVAYAYSSDQGRSWVFRESPVVLPSPAGFDSAKIETPQVFRLGDTLYLAYSADGDRHGRKLTTRYQIGVAELPLHGRTVRQALLEDGSDFERHPKPLLPFDLRPGRFDNNVQEPSVVVRGDRVELFYVGLGLALPEEPMGAPGQAVRSVALGRAELDRDLRVISRSEKPLLDGVNISEVRYFGGAYHLFATTLVPGEFHHGESITHRSSPDGEHWSEPQVILAPGPAGSWDGWGLMAPAVAVEPDRVVLFYTAYQAADHACFPVPRNGRFGRPVDGGAKCLFAALGRAVSSLLPAPPLRPAAPGPGAAAPPGPSAP